VIGAGLGIELDGLSLGVVMVDAAQEGTGQGGDGGVAFGQEGAALTHQSERWHLRHDASLGAVGRVSPHLSLQRHSGLSSQVDAGMDVELHPATGHLIVGGLGVESTQAVGVEDPAWVGNFHAFAQDTWTPTWWLQLTSGARVDQHSQFGAFVSPRAAVVLLPGDRAAVKLLYGRAFRAPNLQELWGDALAGDGGGQANGNPNLRPESTDTVELEASGPLSDLTDVRVALFASDVRDEIRQVPGGPGDLGSWYHENTGGSTVLGAELEGTLTLGDWSTRAAHSVVVARDKDTGLTQFGYPPHSFHGRVTWASAAVGLRLSALVDIVGPQPRAGWAAAPTLQDGPAHGLIHLAAATDALGGGRVRVDISMRNLLNAQHLSVAYLEGADPVATNLVVPGRSLLLGLEASF